MGYGFMDSPPITRNYGVSNSKFCVQLEFELDKLNYTKMGNLLVANNSELLPFPTEIKLLENDYVRLTGNSSDAGIYKIISFGSKFEQWILERTC